jgi:hypothetical protein
MSYGVKRLLPYRDALSGFTYPSSTVRLVPVPRHLELWVFPNRANERLFMRPNGELDIKEIQITDILGRPVLTGQLTSNQLSINNLEKGVYFFASKHQ